MSSDQPLPFRPADRTIDEAAADWFGRSDGGLSPAEQCELQSWLNADHRHTLAFARLAAMSRALNQLSALRPTGARQPDADLPLVSTATPPLPRKRRARWVAVTLAAAAALSFASIVGWNSYSQRPAFTETAITEVGGLRQIILPDGSIIELNTDSAVQVAFDRSTRRVALLRGEAHFKVAKDAARPFTVSVNNVAVRAVGTAFNVRLRSGDIDVLVTEGRVQLDDTQEGRSLLPTLSTTTSTAPDLPAGHRALIRARAQVSNENPGARSAVVTTVPEREISRELAWQQKRLEFGPTPLAIVVAEFNRYNRHQLVIADRELGSLSVGGSFDANGYETLVRLLESSFGISAERRGHETLLRRN
jgi:transmembrane sensor